MLFKVLQTSKVGPKETQSVSLQIIEQIARICTIIWCFGNQYDILGAQNLQMHNLYLSVHLFLGIGSLMVVETKRGSSSLLLAPFLPPPCRQTNQTAKSITLQLKTLPKAQRTRGLSSS